MNAFHVLEKQKETSFEWRSSLYLQCIRNYVELAHKTSKFLDDMSSSSSLARNESNNTAPHIILCFIIFLLLPSFVPM